MATEDPAFPPNPELLNRQPKWFKPVFYISIGLSAVFAIAVIIYLATPQVIRSHRNVDQTEATSNARQIGLALFEFENEYGAFPNAATIPLVEKDYSAAINLSGKSSNVIFRQLLATGITHSEPMFYARIKDSRKPDGDLTSGEFLKPGECGFSYISGLTSKDSPSTPIVLTPLIPGTTKFDPKPFKGKAVILRIDNSATTYDIHKDGHIYDKGINLLSPKHPVWKGKAPDIRYPE